MARPVKHERVPMAFKYSGKNPLHKLREGEPYFFIRAQDKLSVDAVVHYAQSLKKASDFAYLNGDDDLGKDLLKQSLGVLKVASVFADWQLAYPGHVKFPDC